jgi:hypothetical protein
LCGIAVEIPGRPDQPDAGFCSDITGRRRHGGELVLRGQLSLSFFVYFPFVPLATVGLHPAPRWLPDSKSQAN